MMMPGPAYLLRLTRMALSLALLSQALWANAADAEPPSIPLPGVGAFPESITSTKDGMLYIRRPWEGGIGRADPGTGTTEVFVAPGAAGSQSITGVFADEHSKTLWACSVDLSALDGPAGSGDRGSALKGFALRTGAPTRSVALPGPGPFCNDIAVDAA